MIVRVVNRMKALVVGERVLVVETCTAVLTVAKTFEDDTHRPKRFEECEKDRNKDRMKNTNRIRKVMLYLDVDRVQGTLEVFSGQHYLGREKVVDPLLGMVKVSCYK